MNLNFKSGHKGFLVILFIGVILLVVAVVYQVVTDKKINEWTHTDAKVVDYIKESKLDSDGEYEVIYRAVIRYVVDGTVYEVKSASSSNIRPITGMKKIIAYNPENPQQFIEINDGKIVKILLYVLGAIISCAGGILFLVSCRKPRGTSNDADSNYSK